MSTKGDIPVVVPEREVFSVDAIAHIVEPLALDAQYLSEWRLVEDGESADVSVLLQLLAWKLIRGEWQSRRRGVDADDLLRKAEVHAAGIVHIFEELEHAILDNELAAAWHHEAGVSGFTVDIVKDAISVAQKLERAATRARIRLPASREEKLSPGSPGKPAAKFAVQFLCRLFMKLMGTAPTGSRSRKAQGTDGLSMSGAGGKFIAAFFRELRKVHTPAADGVTARTIESEIRRAMHQKPVDSG